MCFHFDALYEHRQKVKLSAEQIIEMVAGMEQQLTTWSDPGSDEFAPFPARDLGLRLVRHYQAADSPTDVKRIVQIYAQGLLHIAEQGNGIFAHHWLEQLHQDYLNAVLRSEADALVSYIRKAGERSVGEMSRISVPLTFTNDEMEGFSQSVTDGNAETAVTRIAETFTPDAEHLRTEMHKVVAKHPLMGMI